MGVIDRESSQDRAPTGRWPTLTGLSRRNALRAVGVGGISLAGLSVAGSAEAAAPTRKINSNAAAPVATNDPPRRLTVTASEIRVVGPRRCVGDQAIITGQLHVSTATEPSGEFFGHTTVVNRRNLLVEATGSMQTHTFVLPDGTLLGSGVLSHQGDGTFAIIGGTDEYQGVSGSYTVQQDLDDFAATAVYSFTFFSRKAFV